MDKKQEKKIRVGLYDHTSWLNGKARRKKQMSPEARIARLLGHSLPRHDLDAFILRDKLKFDDELCGHEII